MPFVPAPTIVKCSWFYTLNGQPAMNRIHVTTGTTLPTEAECASIAASGASWWEDNCQAIVHPNMILREVQAMSIAEANGPQAVFSSGFPLAGTLGQPGLPGNNSFCVSLRTGLTGRSARGRWYWAGLTEGQVTDNEVLSGSVTSIVAALDNLINALTSGPIQPVIVSFVSGGVPRVGGPVYFPITDALAVDNVVDSQRGRLH